MKNLSKRLDLLEQAEHSGPRFPDLTPALMLIYATDEERAQWEAAGKPAVTRAEWETGISQVYALVVPDDAGGFIYPNGQPWKDDGSAVIDLN
jgi:hypothetical protein